MYAVPRGEVRLCLLWTKFVDLFSVFPSTAHKLVKGRLAHSDSPPQVQHRHWSRALHGLPSRQAELGGPVLMRQLRRRDVRKKRAKLRVVPCGNVRARGSGRCVFGLYSRLQDRAQQGRHDVLGVSMRWAVLRHTHPHTTPTPPTPTLPDVMGEPTPNGWPSTVQIVLRVPSAAVHPPRARIAVSNGDFNRDAPFLRPLPRPHLNHAASHTAHCRPS